MARPKQNVSKSQIARELSVSKGRVSQLIKAGMPVGADGNINLERAREWYTTHVRPRMKPNSAPRERGFKSEAEGYLWCLFESLADHPAKVPEVMAELGVCDPDVVERVQSRPAVLLENFNAILAAI